jgi:hypothetical protein
MNTYQTYLTLDHSHKIVLSDLPFEEGTKLSINISIVADEIPASTHQLLPKASSDFHALLDNTQGIWTKGDGLEYQQQVRDEWS